MWSKFKEWLFPKPSKEVDEPPMDRGYYLSLIQDVKLDYAKKSQDFPYVVLHVGLFDLACSDNHVKEFSKLYSRVQYSSDLSRVPLEDLAVLSEALDKAWRQAKYRAVQLDYKLDSTLLLSWYDGLLHSPMQLDREKYSSLLSSAFSSARVRLPRGVSKLISVPAPKELVC